MNINDVNHGINSYYNGTRNNSRRVAQAFDRYGILLKEGELKSGILGSSFLEVAGSDKVYGMVAKYAEGSTEGKPVIKVRVETPRGAEEHCINVKEVDPRNATEIEMFALCTYVDVTGQGAKGMSGSWHMAKYCSDNAGRGKHYRTPHNLEEYWTVKHNWVEMVSDAADGCMGGGLYGQAMNGRKLLSMFRTHIGKYIEPEEKDMRKKEEERTDTDVITKADGSRVLVVTTNIGGMSTVMSLKISDPTDMPNEALGKGIERLGNAGIL